MCDLSKLRELAEAGQDVTLDAGTFLKLLDAAEMIVVQEPRERPKREPRQGTAEDEKCARWLFKVLRVTAPKAKEPRWSTWANDVRLIREQDKRTHKEICELFLWAHKDPFWCTNILCPKSLREKWDRLTLLKDRGVTTGAGGTHRDSAAGQKFNLGSSDRSSDQAAQSAFMERHSIGASAEDIPL